MSLYTFAPGFTLTQNHPFISWENAFNEEQLRNIVQHLETLPKEIAAVGGTNENGVIRRSNVAWVANKSPEAAEIYDTMAFVARSINSKFYGFDLSGFVEDMQYTVYDSDNQGHYTWHTDMSEESPSTRKLSLVLQLSSPDEYEGGELQTLTTSREQTVEQKLGMISAFPSWTLHRVTPVTKGIRRTLVVWVAGPQFR